MVTGNVYLAPKYFLPGFIPIKMKMILKENLGSTISHCPALWLNDQLISRQEDLTRGGRWGGSPGHTGRRAGSTGRRKEETLLGMVGVESQPCPRHASQSLVTVEPRLHLRFKNADETMRWTYCHQREDAQRTSGLLTKHTAPSVRWDAKSCMSGSHQILTRVNCRLPSIYHGGMTFSNFQVRSRLNGFSRLMFLPLRMSHVTCHPHPGVYLVTSGQRAQTVGKGSAASHSYCIQASYWIKFCLDIFWPDWKKKKSPFQEVVLTFQQRIL